MHSQPAAQRLAIGKKGNAHISIEYGIMHSAADSRAHKYNYTDAQANKELNCVYISEGPFPRATSQIVFMFS